MIDIFIFFYPHIHLHDYVSLNNFYEARGEESNVYSQCFNIKQINLL